MFVLGIDPGLSRCGYAAVDATGRRRRVCTAIGVLTTAADRPAARSASPSSTASSPRLIAELHAPTSWPSSRCSSR